MTDVVGGERLPGSDLCLDPGSSQRWARSVAACASCGEPIYRRSGSKTWLHGSTHLRFSNQSGSHLARPRSTARSAA